VGEKVNDFELYRLFADYGGDRVLDGFTGSGTALLAADLKKRMTHKTIAKKRVLSEEMVTYRIRVTGVARQIASGKRRRSL
jgi:hypothetical protein